MKRNKVEQEKEESRDRKSKTKNMDDPEGYVKKGRGQSKKRAKANKDSKEE